MSLPLNLFGMMYRLLCLDTLWRSAAGICRFTAAWLRSRRYGRLAAGLPPLLAGLIVTAAILAHRVPAVRQHQLAEYLTAARDSSQRGDVTATRMNYRRAVQLSAGQREVRHEYAVALFELGETNEALRMFSGMAPLSKTGFLPAHQFLADHFETENPRITELVRTLHLTHVVRQSRTNRDDRQRLCKQLITLGQLSAAEDLLRETLDQFPEDRLLLVRLRSAAGDGAAAVKQAQVAVQELQPLVEQQPQDVTRRIQLAQSHVYLGEFGRSLMVLAEGMNPTPEARLTSAIAKNCMHWMSLLPPARQTATRACLEQLMTTEAASSGDQSDRAVAPDPDILSEEFFLRILQSEHQTLMLQFLIGTVNAAEHRLPEAETCLRTALHMAPENAMILNNLACVLMQRAQQADAQGLRQTADAVLTPRTPVQTSNSASDAAQHPTAAESSPGQTSAVNMARSDTSGFNNAARTDKRSGDILLSEALQLIDAALRVRPSVGEFHETKAQILTLQGEHASAGDHLRLCLAAGLEEPGIHRQLAKNLMLLGSTEESMRHMARAVELERSAHATREQATRTP